jgi:AAA+ superfamily predicted ATPase
MDGFEQNEGVIVIGATNRVEDLDKVCTQRVIDDPPPSVSMPHLIV